MDYKNQEKLRAAMLQFLEPPSPAEYQPCDECVADDAVLAVLNVLNENGYDPLDPRFSRLGPEVRALVSGFCSDLGYCRDHAPRYED
jgi:hypothetical protein